MEATARFQRLAAPHLPAAFNLAFWLVRSRPDAEDIVQEALLRAFRSFSTFEGDTFRPWFFAIVRNVAYTTMASRNQFAQTVSLDEAFGSFGADDDRQIDIPLDEPTQEDRMIEASDRDAVLQALSRLPAIYREVLVLREIEGLAYREICRITGTAPGTVMSRISRGRSELKRILLAEAEKGQAHAMR